MQIDYVKILYKEDVHIFVQILQIKWNKTCMKQLASGKRMENDCFSEDLEVWDVGKEEALGSILVGGGLILWYVGRGHEVVDRMRRGLVSLLGKKLFQFLYLKWYYKNKIKIWHN
jgi:hypothetical protein